MNSNSTKVNDASQSGHAPVASDEVENVPAFLAHRRACGEDYARLVYDNLNGRVLDAVGKP